MKFIKEAVVFDYEMVSKEMVDIAVIINNVDLLNMEPKLAWDILNIAGLIKDDKFIIPIGTKIISIDQNGGSIEYALKYNDNLIKLDLAFDNQSEYIAA